MRNFKLTHPAVQVRLKRQAGSKAAYDTWGRTFACVIANALHDGRCSAVAHAESLRSHAPEIGLALHRQREVSSCSSDADFAIAR